MSWRRDFLVLGKESWGHWGAASSPQEQEPVPVKSHWCYCKECHPACVYRPDLRQTSSTLPKEKNSKPEWEPSFEVMASVPEAQVRGTARVIFAAGADVQRHNFEQHEGSPHEAGNSHWGRHTVSEEVWLEGHHCSTSQAFVEEESSSWWQDFNFLSDWFILRTLSELCLLSPSLPSHVS